MNLNVQLTHIPIVNFAMQQNHVPIIREIIVKNISETDLKMVCINISFEPDFAINHQLNIESIPAGKEERISTIPIQMSTTFLSQLTERLLGQIHIEIIAEGESLFKESYEISLLAFDQWGGISVLPEMLAAFVTPNHPAIIPIIKRASDILGNWTNSPSLDEYQRRDPNRVKKQMAAIYEAIAEQQISYCSVPASFEESGQRVRLYDDLLSNKLGNCLDMSLLYAGCLEAVGIHPIVTIIRGHAFAGGWLIPDSFSDSVNDDVSLLTKRTADGINEILMVETTCMNTGSPMTFDLAMAAANDKMKETYNFVLFVDILRARNAQIRPLPLRVMRDGIPEIVEEPPMERNLDAPSSLSATDIITESDKRSVEKQIIWERKLLDLSLRNNLLNTRITKNTLQLISVQIGDLEDALADGKEFQVLERPQDWDNPMMSAGIYQSLHSSDPIINLVKGELEQQRLRAYLNEDALKRSLTHLYRSSRLSLEENGANTLYIALGFLKWLETPHSIRPRFAPILLIPIEIIRKSAAKGYVIRSRGEETMLNITLIEMLRQFFNIQIGGLDPLPRDGSGVDVSKIFNTFRRAIMTQKGWDVEEQAIIGNFSFNKFIMWNDIHNNADKLRRNKIVASLMSGKIEWELDTEDNDELDLDEAYPAGKIALPIGADSSQFEAICAAIDDKSFILHGPPGTGKSQTITNIIANALYNGKKVLFVAEKMAALQVVQRRLEAIGIAPFCLEIHSNKTKKSNVLEQLKRTTEVVKQKSNEEYRIVAQQINALRKELNDYVHILHKPRPAGLSLYDSFSGYSSVDYDGTLIDVPVTFLESLNPDKRAICAQVVEEYKTACRICNDPHTHPLKGIGVTAYTSALKAKAKDVLSNLSQLLQENSELLRNISSLFGFTPDELTPQLREGLLEVTKLLLEAEIIAPSLLSVENSAEIFKLIDEAVKTGEERDFKRNQILETYDKKILTADVSAWENQFKELNLKWWLPRTIGLNKLQKQIQSYTKYFTKPTIDSLPKLFSKLNAYNEAQEHIQSLGTTISPLLGLLWNNGEASWYQFAKARTIAEQIEKALLQATYDIALTLKAKRTLKDNLECGLQTFLQVHYNKLKRFVSIEKLISEKIDEAVELLSISPLANGSIGQANDIRSLIDKWNTNLDLLHDWATYNLQKQEMLSADLDFIVNSVEEGTIATDKIDDSYHKSVYKSYAEHILSQEPRMNAFHGILFDEKIRRFRVLSKHFEKLTRDELFARLAAELPALQKEAAQSSEVGILQRNIRNGGRGTSIRKLFDQIPDLLTRMCPCLLMSPISVAQYIDAKRAPFDIVIFDEASQMPTCEAVGAIARGSNVIVVGDPKQMPPTDFFSANTYDEENADKEDLESILDDCLALSIPSKHLLWHYRSKHESLIAFSNVKYYENRLMTFPSPDDLTTKVNFQYVNGIYDRGASRQNLAEAKAIVQEIKTRLTDPRREKRSIGVVTFNSNQQSLIEDLLNEQFQKTPSLEPLALEGEEPIFIKNLENVQGDERDVILISVGYGPDNTGRIAHNFGPLNRDGGWRRLNVAVSRARYEMKVFSSLCADQIDLNRSSAEGVAGLKSFLEYAEKGRESLFYATSGENKSGDNLLHSIANELKSKGYNVRLNIGCSGYRIDIGVVDPSNPEKYLLGILCDGYNHASTRTAHDRVITQSSVLQMLGWQICQVWAMDWWENRERAIESLVNAIEDAKNGIVPTQDTFDTLETPEYSETSEEISETEPALFDEDKAASADEVTDMDAATDEEEEIEEDAADAEDNTDPLILNEGEIRYKRADLLFTYAAANDFAEGDYDFVALEKIRTTVEIEAPISKSLLCKRVLNSFGISRMGARLAAHMEDLLWQSELKTTGTDNIFYWSDKQDPETYNTYRIISSREALDIAPEEVSVAITHILKEQGALPEEDLIRETAHKFTFSRMGDNVVASMTNGIEHAIKMGHAIRSDGKIKPI